MNVVADECVVSAVIDRLRSDGHEVLAVREECRGDVDPRVLALAAARAAPLLTEDKDFGELVYRLASGHRGVVLIRLAGLSRALKADLVSRAFADHGPQFVDRFSVIEPGGIRIRQPSRPADFT